MKILIVERFTVVCSTDNAALSISKSHMDNQTNIKILTNK